MADQKSAQKRAYPIVERLEPRILLSADIPLAELVVIPGQESEPETDLQQLEQNLRQSDQILLTADDTHTAAVGKQLIVVDPQVDSYLQLISDIENQFSGATEYEIIVLSSEQDGVEQLTSILASRDELAAVHLISHGNDGQLTLAATSLTQSSLEQYSGQISQWSSAFAADGDLLLYGCNLAASADGQALLNQLASLTLTDVAASEGPTGSSEQGGDWQLEFASGVVETAGVLNDFSSLQWQGLLAANTAPTFDVGSNGDSIAIVDFNSGSGESTEKTVLQPDGKMLVSGVVNVAGYDQFSVTRYNADGTIDNSFGANGTVSYSVGSGHDNLAEIALQDDGKIILVGSAGSTTVMPDIGILRLNADGSLDTSFSSDGKAAIEFFSGEEDVVTGVAIQPDGKILIAGSSFDGSAFVHALARLNSDGSLDSSFGSGGKVTTDASPGSDQLHDITLQFDGKIVVTGAAELVDGGDDVISISRYLADGFLDTSFGAGGIVLVDLGGSVDRGYDVRVLDDGKLLVGVQTNSTLHTLAMLRFNSDGSMDLSFGANGKAEFDINGWEINYGAMKVLDSGQVLIGGTSWDGVKEGYLIARINSDGTLDAGFGASGYYQYVEGRGESLSTIKDIDVDIQGNIIITTDRFTVSSNSDHMLIFLDEDGVLNSSFKPAGYSSSLDNNPAYTEGGAAVVLDADVQVSDTELRLDNNFDGASLTLVRNGGASANDIFSATGTLAALTQSNDLVVDGTTIGIVTTNSAGFLVLTFNVDATNYLVNKAMQQIAYSNSSDGPSANVQINWDFNDGNSGAQGAGGALSGTGSTTVNITATNDAPLFESVPVTSAVTDRLYSFSIQTSDPDLAALLNITATGLPAWLSLVDHGDGTATLSGTPEADGLGLHTITLEVSDGITAIEQSLELSVIADAVIVVSESVSESSSNEPEVSSQEGAGSGESGVSEAAVSEAGANAEVNQADSDDSPASTGGGQADDSAGKAAVAEQVVDFDAGYSQGEGEKEARAKEEDDPKLHLLQWSSQANSQETSSFASDTDEAKALNNDLDNFAKQLSEENKGGGSNQALGQVMVGATAAASFGLFSMIARGGSLIASLMVSMPFWKLFDPLPILSGHTEKQGSSEKNNEPDDEKEERIDDLFNR